MGEASTAAHDSAVSPLGGTARQGRFGEDLLLMPRVTDPIVRPISRVGAAAQNALELARFGGLATDQEPSPYEVAREHRIYRLRHYYPGPERRDGRTGAPPVLLVPPMMLAAEVYDVAANTSAVTILREHGVDPWVVDFGAPERERGGLERTLTDHVLAVSDAVESVQQATGRQVHLSGYSQGGMFCYQAAAFRRNAGIGSLITFGSPVDTRIGMPLGLPEGLARELAELLPTGVPGSGSSGLGQPHRLPDARSGQVRCATGWSSCSSSTIARRLLSREGQRRFLEGEGWVAWPGPAMAEFLRQFISSNRMLDGGFLIEDRLVTLADIECPVLTVLGTVDQLAPAAGVRAITQAAPRAEVYELDLRAGHFGLVVGSSAVSISWPTVAGWAQWRDGERDLPETVTAVSDSAMPETDRARPQPDGLRARAGPGARERRGALDGRDGRAHGAYHARAGSGGGRPAAAAGPARADPAGDEDLAGSARPGACPQPARRGLLPVRGSRPHGLGLQPSDRQRRPGPD